MVTDQKDGQLEVRWIRERLGRYNTLPKPPALLDTAQWTGVIYPIWEKPEAPAATDTLSEFVSWLPLGALVQYQGQQHRVLCRTSENDVKWHGDNSITTEASTSLTSATTDRSTLNRMDLVLVFWRAGTESQESNSNDWVKRVLGHIVDFSANGNCSICGGGEYQVLVRFPAANNPRDLWVLSTFVRRLDDFDLENNDLMDVPWREYPEYPPEETSSEENAVDPHEGE